MKKLRTRKCNCYSVTPLFSATKPKLWDMNTEVFVGMEILPRMRGRLKQSECINDQRTNIFCKKTLHFVDFQVLKIWLWEVMSCVLPGGLLNITMKFQKKSKERWIEEISYGRTFHFIFFIMCMYTCVYVCVLVCACALCVLVREWFQASSPTILHIVFFLLFYVQLFCGRGRACFIYYFY